jgi:cystathionine beta-synthase
MKCPSLLDAIGRTPLVSLNRIAAPARILLKCEHLNPSGSVKDRMALHIITKAEAEGRLKPGGLIVENTSGNTGAAVACIARAKGYRAIFTIPDKMSREKIDALKAYGAEVIVCPTAVPPADPRSYYSVARRLAQEHPGSFYVNQYNNPDNIEAYYRMLGPELWDETKGAIDIFVACAGTGGTISGTGKYLKERNPAVRVVGVDAEGSVFTDYFKTGKLVEPHVYKMEGLGEDMLVDCMDFSVVDDFIQVSDRDGFLTARRLAREEGVFTGGSSGAALWAALKVAESYGKGKTIVVVLPDHGNRYLSKLYNDDWMRENSFID